MAVDEGATDGVLDLLALDAGAVDVATEVAGVLDEQPEADDEGEVVVVEFEDEPDEEWECEEEVMLDELVPEAVETVDRERVAVTVEVATMVSKPLFQLLTGFLDISGSSTLLARALLSRRKDTRLLSATVFSGISSPLFWSPSTNQDPTTPHQPTYAASNSDSEAANAFDTPLGVGLFSILSKSIALAPTRTAV